jgi:hypothetical protein
MRESHYETITETKEKEIGYVATCNKCGKRNEINHNIHNGWEDDIKEFYVSFGYESSFDGEKWSFDLCEDCLVGIIKGFKYVPDGFKDDDYNTLTKEEHQKVFENWKLTGKWEDLKFKTYEELKELNNGWFSLDWLNDAIKNYHPDKPLLTTIDNED